MAAQSGAELQRGAVGLTEVLFQSITFMAPAVAAALSVGYATTLAGGITPLAVVFALIACLFTAYSMGQFASRMTSAGGMYTWVSRGLGPFFGWLVAWIYTLAGPIVPAALYASFGFFGAALITELTGFTNDWLWLVLTIVCGLLVWALTYYGIRLSTRVGVVLGVIEIGIFLALAIWMLLSNLGDLTLQTFNPSNNEVGTLEGTFKGMVFAILAFIGFESAAPLGEECRKPRWAIPRAVVGSAVIVGLFYVICSYAWVIGTGFGSFTETATAAANPWRDLGEVFWGAGWVLIFFAIVNSAIANANAGTNAATRVLFALARNGVLPRALAKTHPVHRTPHVATIAVTALGTVIALLLGWKWDPLTGFVIIATAVTLVVICVYIAVCVACAVYYWREKRAAWDPWLHGVFPALGAVAFLAPLYYQFNPLPDYPIRYGTWIAVGWLAAGVVVTAWMYATKPDALGELGKVFVEDEPVGVAGPFDVPPPTAPAPATGQPG